MVITWHYYKKQYNYFTYLEGKISRALYDSRKEPSTFSEIDEFILSIDKDKPKLLCIVPQFYHGFKCISKEEAIVINIPTCPYNKDKPDEYRLTPYSNDISYD
ncbi:MAG: dTDP-4-dehydrorhamnose 3,5-epimerase family protein [Candidatus Omnitrophica bacterium]|nr:dTDP-4-dehydrorhamnose 3,5-epimerase family protein [Candidatus Omnitrophota bacterium]